MFFGEEIKRLKTPFVAVKGGGLWKGYFFLQADYYYHYNMGSKDTFKILKIKKKIHNIIIKQSLNADTIIH